MEIPRKRIKTGTGTTELEQSGGQEIQAPKGKLGVMIPGMGAVATTFVAGVEAVRKGIARPIGSLTQMGTSGWESAQTVVLPRSRSSCLSRALTIWCSPVGTFLKAICTPQPQRLAFSIVTCSTGSSPS